MTVFEKRTPKALAIELEVVAPSQVGLLGPGFALRQGDKPWLTPAGAPYVVPTQALAEKIAQEWRAQGEKVVPSTMPLTQLAATALDVVAKDPARILNQTLAYAQTELLCHRAELPEALAKEQERVWQPFLAWLDSQCQAALKVGVGIMPVPQPAHALEALRALLETFDVFALAGLSSAVDATGSLVLGLALAKAFAPVDQIFQAAELEAHFQGLAWGSDPVTDARFCAVRRELEACALWFALL